MAQTNPKKHAEQNNHPVQKSGSNIITRGKKKGETSVHQAKPAISKRAAVDDVTWDKAVIEVMEEYDEAWTQLADS